MGRYLREAEQHADKIKDLYDCAGPIGHQQAEYYFHELQGLVRRAGSSKNDKSDVAPILALLELARQQMQEMAERRDEWAAHSKQLPPQG